MTGPFIQSPLDDEDEEEVTTFSPSGQPASSRLRLDRRSRLPKFRRPTFRQIIRWVLFSPFYLLRFILMLPVHLIRFLIKLPRRIWWLWTQGALGLYKVRLGLLRGYRGAQEGVRLARVHNPPRRVYEALYIRLHPLALWHRLGVWRTRLRRNIWQGNKSLSHVQNALRWSRQYRRHKARFSDINALRSILYADKTIVQANPLHPSVGTVARRISIKKKWGSFLHSLVRFSEAQRILELGTGYGMSGLYIAQGMLECYPMRTCMFITLEKDEERIEKARYHFRRVAYDDFTIVKTGDIADTLVAALQDLKPPDLVLMDGPIDGELVQGYFETIKAASFPGTLVIITNIHRKRSMTKCWHAVKKKTGLAATVDLWRWGIIVIGEPEAKPVHLWARL